MKIKLKNYCDKWSEHDIGETSDIVVAVLQELSGDEVLTVYRSGNRSEVYDSAPGGRHTDYDDGSCVVFSEGKWDEEFLRIHEVKALSKDAEPDVVSPKKAPDAKAKDEPKRTRVTNAEKYKTAEERAKAFEKFCNVHDKCGCTGCPLSDIKPDCGDSRGQFYWLDLEAEAEKPLPCPFCGGEVERAETLIGKKGFSCSCGYTSKAEFGWDNAIAAHNRVAKAMMEAEKEGAEK